MRTIDIPGGTATLRDPQDLSERHRRLVKTLAFQIADLADKLAGVDPAKPETLRLDELNLDEHNTDLLFRLQDAAIIATLAGWTLDLPLPTLETVQDLPGGLYDALSQASSATAVTASVDFGPVMEADPKVRTGKSKPSGGRAKVSAAR